MKTASEGRRGLKDLFGSWRKIIRLSRKPDREEFNLLLKLNLLGFTLVGSIAYIIHIIATVVAPALVG